MSLCESCSAIRIQLLSDVVDSRKAGDPPPSGVLHSTTAQLLHWSETCPLCAIIRAYVNRVGAFHRSVMARVLVVYIDLRDRDKPSRVSDLESCSGLVEVTPVPTLLGT